MKVKKSDLKKWQEHCKTVQEMTIVNLLESESEKRKRIDKALKDYEYFVNYYFPHYATSQCAKFHIDTANAVAENKKIRLCAEWARGHAKSTHFDILIPLWLKAKGDLKVMLLVGKSEESAKLLLSDVQAELEFNQRYINDFGIQFNGGHWETGRFVTADDVAFFSIGRGQSPRGIRWKQSRVTYTVLDDIDDDQLSTNDSLVSRLVDWVFEALFPAMDMSKNNKFICVGNRISKNSVLAKVAETEGILHTVVNAVDENGEPTWKEKYSKEDIEEAKKTMGSRRWEKEMKNNPVTDGAVFKLKDIKYKEMSLTDYKYLVCYTDPSFKSGIKNDCKATVLCGHSSTGEYHILKSYVAQTTVTNLIQWHYEISRNFTEVPIYYYMEANFIQDILFKEFYTEGEKNGVQIPILPDKRNKPEKFQRIESMQPVFERGLVFCNEIEKDNCGMKKLIEQLLMTEKGSRFPDDGPDALEGCFYIMEQRKRKDYPIIIGKRDIWANPLRY